MGSFIIEGPTPLTGSISVSGNKNAVLPAMAASLLTDKQVILENVPHIRDVKTMGLLLQDLGVSVEGVNARTLKLVARHVERKEPDQKLVADLRASILLMGPLLARIGTVKLRHPGGDIIGKRSVDEHLAVLQQLGATLKRSGIEMTLSTKRLRGSRIHLREASVTATENAMMAAVLAHGDTKLTNAASEPHVLCLGDLLTKMGANICGLGTSTIDIHGVSSLSGCTHTIRPDHIEVGTWAIAGAVTGGDVTIHNVVEGDLASMLSSVAPMGVVTEIVRCRQHPSTNGLVCIRARQGKLIAASPHLRTNVWPGFPTDLMSPAIVLATQCQGTTLAHDWMYEGRMFFVDRLIKMGANIIIADPHRVIVNGPTPLYARHTSSPDIRAGIALVIAALVAKGRSQIDMAEIIDRGYEQVEKRLQQLGASIRRIG